jgi:hypothetical protein
MGSEVKDGAVIITNKDVNGTSVQFSLKRGTAWGNTVKVGPAKLQITPQIALWIEDSSGKLLQNIYITKRFAKQEWRSIKSHPDSTYRTMSLPFWLNRMIAAGLPIPTQSKPLADAVTAATPPGSFTINTHIDSQIKSGIIWCEVNSSFDNNEVYSKDKPNPFNGQPSVLFNGEYNSTDTSHSPVQLIYKGHGGDSGKDGALYTDNSGITTARSIIESIEYVIKK